MRKFLVVGSLLGIVLPLTAAAQPPPPPPPGGGGGMAPVASEEPKMRFDIGLIAGIPQGDYDDGVDTSPGIWLAFGFNVAPNISIFGAARYFAIQVKGDDGGVDYSNYSAIAGGRYAAPVSPTVKLFGEAMFLYDTVSVEFGGQSDSESGIGFGGRAGALFHVGSGNMNIGAAASFTTASIDIGGTDLDSSWLGLEGFVSFGF
jgi:hypothetical protein